MAQVRSTTPGVVLVVGLVCIVGLALAPGVLAQAGGGSDEESFGAQVSSFMQSTAADADGSVDSGMWAANANGSEAPGQAVSKRAATLQERLQAIENESEVLAAARANGTISGVAYTARASAVHARLANLRAAVNQTMTAADRYGVNETRLDALRAAAGNATGPEIAAMARNITDAGRTPPPWAGGDGDPPGGPPTDGPGADPGNDGGPPDDAPGGGGGNGPEGGPPTGGPDGGSGNGNPGGQPGGGPSGNSGGSQGPNNR